ncbi:hypothetical protein JCGZ_20847 [Jatropha curcas]|uniref:Uncharacterized protein n=1 Tax=Jatropha curcas TaxID=180498 RepID=A0A067L605_JATCU|nr:hypothetical protein JCGZ_20847 [Jatropha curcas]
MTYHLAAISASKRVHFLTPERPNSVLALLNEHGFTNSQIAKLGKYNPGFLLADPEKTIFRKLKFFSSVGITGPDLAKFISTNPTLLRHSLPNQIIPAYKFVRSALLFDDEMVIRALRLGSRILLYDVEKIMAPNLLVLRETGMTKSLINMLLTYHSSLIGHKVDKFRDKVREVINMGFCPTKTKFIQALHAIINISESNWLHKIELYGRYGWSQDEMLSVFKKHPLCMTFSEKKIIGCMDFLVNVMDMKPSEIAGTPYLLCYSVKKRIIPRGLVIKILKSKGALEKNISFSTVVGLTDKCFVERYMDKHREHIPYLQDVFEGRMCPQELGLQYGQ